MTSAVRTLLLALVLLVLAVPAAVGAPPDDQADKAQTTEIQILGLNDFHGNLRPPDETTSSGRIGPALPVGVAAGGIEYLATHVRRLEATNPNTLFVSAGDLIGASPLISAAFHDEPTIEGFNLMGLDYNGVGNHEFDEGVAELRRMQEGGCHPTDGCQDGDGFEGADFQFLAANVKYKATGDTIFPPYEIEKFQGGIKIAIVGMTLEGTPSIVTQSAVADIDFFDEADSVNALVPELKKQGVETIIVLLHEGGSVSEAISQSTINNCANPSGPVVDVVDRMDPEIDVVVTGHTNWAVNCVRPDGKIMTGAASFGRLVTDIDLTVSRATKDVVRAQTKVNNVIVTRDVAKAPDLTALVSKYATLAAPTENRLIGQATAALTRTTNAAGESSLGDIIADAQLWGTSTGAPQPIVGGPAVISFMNAGGIRADINAGPITYGEAFTVQPFGNILVTMTMTGAQIDAVLEQQFTGGNGILQVPASLTYERHPATAAPDRARNIRVNGAALDPAASYRVTVNNFLADGGDGYTVFRQGTSRYFGEIDLDAFARYLTAITPTSPGPQNRITLIP